MENSHADFLAALDGLSEADMTSERTLGDWSIKDLLSHLAFWEEQAISMLRLVAEGRASDVVRPVNPQQIKSWNAREVANRRDLPLAAIFDGLVANYHELQNAVNAISEEEWQNTRVRSWRGHQQPISLIAALDTYEHYNEHRQQIIGWRQSRVVASS